jgi:xanthine dehydrogenase accessory factor
MTKDHKLKTPLVLIRGGGDLASGVVIRLHRVGVKVIITELPQPLAVRRLVSFSEAIYQGEMKIEGVVARRIDAIGEIPGIISGGEIPIMIDPSCDIRRSKQLRSLALIDARMTKRKPDIGIDAAPFVIGLGPGFTAGENVHAVIETNRGHYLGRVIWKGSPESDTGIPGMIGQRQKDRVLRSPAAGKFNTRVVIGSQVREGSILADVEGSPIKAPFDGILRGLLRDGLLVKPGMKVGDLDPRGDPLLTRTVSEKSFAIAGGVLEALLTAPEIRASLWS